MISSQDHVDIVGNYRIIETVGFGAFSQVFKAAHCKTDSIVAIKRMILNLNCRKDVAKEVLIHQHLKHQNIIKFIEVFEEDEFIYIVQELAGGGELFEQIEPDYGFPEQVAHFYFVQLIKSITYLHKIGVCHRDLKPENLLLDGFGNLKLADFGFSTLFIRAKNRRKLTTRCGTPAYMSPEVSKSSEYEGDDADIWSCCIILIILLTGSLPWDNSTSSCPEFVTFMKTKSNPRINLIPEGPKRIVNEILKLDPSKRWKLDDLISDPWYLQDSPLFNFKFMASDPSKLIQLIRDNSSTQLISLSIPLALTQPEQIRSRAAYPLDCFSQPQVSDSKYFENGENSNVFVRNNFARFLCSGSIKDLNERLGEILEEMLVPYQSSENMIHFQTVDRRKCPLVGQISMQNLADSVLVVFKKTRGNPIEYVRFFKFIIEKVSDLIQ